jgi:hypothetical protein
LSSVGKSLPPASPAESTQTREQRYDDVVSSSGQVKCSSAVADLVGAVLAVEGVVGVDEQIGFDVDDCHFPIMGNSDPTRPGPSRRLT